MILLFAIPPLDFPAGFILVMMALQTAKRDLRKRMRETLSALSNASIVQQCWLPFGNASAFHSIPSCVSL
jgi:hypothetical protein